MVPISEIIMLTRHAQTRLQQRGVPYRVLRLLLAHGDVTVHAGEGCENVTLSREAAQGLVREGFNPDDVAKARRVAAVLGQNGVATVLYPTKRGRGRRFRRQLPTRRGRHGGR